MTGIMHLSSAPCHYSILNLSVLNMNTYGVCVCVCVWLPVFKY